MALSAEDTKQAVEELRKRFFEDCDKTCLEAFYESDVQKLKTDDAYCGLYISHHQGNLDQALQHAKDNLKWRKEFGVQELKESHLSVDYKKEPNIFKFNHDKEGNPIVLLIVKSHKKDSKRSEDQKRMIVYWVEKMINESPKHRITILYDCTDSGYSNMDLEMTMFVANLFIKLYPDSLGHLLVYDMPWLFNAIWKVIKPLLPKHARHRVKFVDKQSIKENIDDKCLPTRMGGQDSSEFRYPSLENGQ